MARRRLLADSTDARSTRPQWVEKIEEHILRNRNHEWFHCICLNASSNLMQLIHMQWNNNKLNQIVLHNGLYQIYFYRERIKRYWYTLYWNTTVSFSKVWLLSHCRKSKMRCTHLYKFNKIIYSSAYWTHWDMFKMTFLQRFYNTTKCIFLIKNSVFVFKLHRMIALGVPLDHKTT